MLTTFGANLNVAVIGASGGIGAALHARLAASPEVAHTYALSRNPGSDPDALAIDVTDENSVAAAAERIRDRTGGLHVVFVATGALHSENGMCPEKSWRTVSMDGLERAFRINAAGPALVAKHFLPLMPREGRVAFAAISARVGSIADNLLGGWYGYRMSKAALNMAIRTLAIELARRNPDALCLALHPGTVDTRLSAPFQAGVPAERLFTPERSARHLLEVLERLEPSDTGGFYAWDGSRIAF